jgi:hypothetical protein
MNQPHGEGQGEGGPPDTRPYFCIPYWTKPLTPGGQWDTGQQRPLPSSVVFYLCESIQASDYTPGQDLHVSVAVRNSGGGNSASIATVVVYWADPTAGFAKLNFFGATTVAVLPDRVTGKTETTPTMTAKIPADAPDHICLLAIVSHPQDKAGTAYDPIGDRHWAQRNLTSVAVAPGAPVIVPFKLANPFAHEAELDLQIAPADRGRAVIVAGRLGLENANTQPTLRLLDENGAELTEAGQSIARRFDLKARDQLALQVMIDLSEPIASGTAGTVEALVMYPAAEQEGRTVGALGIALLPAQ